MVGQNDNYGMVPGVVKFIETESRTVVTGGGGNGEEELFNESVFVLQNEKVLEICCTTK